VRVVAGGGLHDAKYAGSGEGMRVVFGIRADQTRWNSNTYEYLKRLPYNSTYLHQNSHAQQFLNFQLHLQERNENSRLRLYMHRCKEDIDKQFPKQEIPEDWNIWDGPDSSATGSATSGTDGGSATDVATEVTSIFGSDAGSLEGSGGGGSGG